MTDGQPADDKCPSLDELAAEVCALRTQVRRIQSWQKEVENALVSIYQRMGRIWRTFQ